MQISIKSDIHLLAGHLQKLQKQIPFITAKALTNIAIDVQKATTRQLKKDINNPTPFTQRAIAYKWATKYNLKSIVYIRKVQSSYLKYQIVGGIKHPKNKAIVVPFNIKLNKYGNMPKRKVKTLLAKPNTFSGEVKGIAGIWQRGTRNRKGIFKGGAKAKGAVKLLAAYEPNVSYNPNFYFYERAKATAKSVIRIRINEAMKFAIKTAK